MVRGKPNSIARVIVDNGALDARIDTDGQTFLLHPARRFDGIDSHEMIAYSDRDARPNHLADLPCGSASDKPTHLSALSTPSLDSAIGTPRRVFFDDFPEMYAILVGDESYLTGPGSQVEMEATLMDTLFIMRHRFNMNPKFFGSILGVEALGVSPLETRAVEVLTQFNSGFASTFVGMIQLFTERNLVKIDGVTPVRGLSVRNGACIDGPFEDSNVGNDGLSIVRRQPTARDRSIATAHELGHNLGACHIGAIDSGCIQTIPACVNPASYDQGTIMSTSLSAVNKDHFDLDCNMSVVRDHVLLSRAANPNCYFSRKCGDANMDCLNSLCEPTSIDAQLALLMSVNAVLANPIADVDQDGFVFASDALLLLQRAVGQPVQISPCGNPFNAF